MRNLFSSTKKVVMLIAFLLFTGCVSRTLLPTATPPSILTPTSDHIKTVAPNSLPYLTIAYLDGQSLIFECLEKDDCIRNIDLSKIKLPGSSFRLGSVHYLDPVNIFAWLYSDETNHGAVLRINRNTGEIMSIDLPSASLEGMIAHGRLVFRDYNDSKIYIVQDDLSVKTVELGVDIFQLIEAGDNKIIAVNFQPLEQDGKTFIETFVIDVRSGEFDRELVRCPAFTDPLNLPNLESNEDTLAGWLITVSADLKYVYLFYNHRSGDGGYKQAIGVFDTDTLDEVNSAKDPAFITFLNQTRLSSQQYWNMSYPRMAFTNTEGLSQGLNAPMNLTTLQPLVDTLEIIKAEYIKALRFAPFGDNFAIGAYERIFLVSLDGKTVVEYPLPLDHIPLVNGKRDYRIVEYRVSTSAP